MVINFDIFDFELIFFNFLHKCLLRSSVPTFKFNKKLKNYKLIILKKLILLTLIIQ